MKIKAFLFAALLLAGVSAYAQEAESAPATKGPFITNEFGDNWFIGAGLGLNMTVDTPVPPLFQGFGLAGNFNFGKWIDPMWGIRAGFNGLTNNYKGDNFIPILAHGDVMWNVTNQFIGYDKNRKWDIVPYLSAGFLKTFKGGGQANFLVGPGILAKFKLSERLDLDVDPNFYFVRESSLNAAVNGGKAVIAAVLVGVSYKLGVHDWETKDEALMPATIAAAEAAAALAAVQAEKEQIAAEKEEAEAAQEEAAKENEALKQELSENAAQNEAIVKNLMETPAIVYFEIGQATLSVKELEHFDRIVKTMLSQDSEIKFSLTGLTDHNTGSARRNKQLQKQRANYIHKLLTDKYGLNENQFEITVDESAQNRFTTIELNRAVVIEAAKAAEEAPAEEPAE
ncbi:MAG: OmpA family protein [Bacteroidales bacterium]|nr:OmpA family protein [Bacteroidales bacterium]